MLCAHPYYMILTTYFMGASEGDGRKDIMWQMAKGRREKRGREVPCQVSKFGDNVPVCK